MSSHTPRRRRFPRIPSENPVLVNKLGDKALESITKTRIVGLGGCMFMSHEPLGKGSLLQILITVKGEVVECLARVVYEIPRDDEYQVGVEFLFLNEANQKKLATLFPVMATGD